MAGSTQRGRCVISVDNVSVTLNSESTSITQVRLTTTELQLLDSDSHLHFNIPLISVTAIEVHQPIFGTNYIDVDYTNSGGQQTKAVLTFNGGRATEFAQTFFRITDGSLETGNEPLQHTAPQIHKTISSEPTNDKKNQ